MGQFAFDLGGGATARLLAGLYATRWDSPGRLRQDDLDAGRVGFFGVSPNAGFQGGFSARALLAATIDVRHPNERAELQAFAMLRDLNAMENATGYLERPDTGDLRSSRYAGAMFGARGYYHRSITAAARVHEAEVGWFLRHDRFNVVEQALDARTMAPLATADTDNSNTDVRVTDIGLYLDAAVRPFAWLTLRGAARFDVLAYDVDGLAFNASAMQFERTARTAIGSHLGPKATTEFDLGRGFAALVSFGSGFRSPDARSVPHGGPIEFARATSEEIGVRYALPAAPGRTVRAMASFTVFHTFVDNDSVFDPTQGDSVAVGPTRRLGAVLWLRTQPLAWLDVNASFAYTHATAEANGLDGLLHAGDALPYLPWLVARLDAAADHQIATWRTLPVHVRGGLGAGLRGPRPLLLNESSTAVFLLDAAAGVRIGPVALDLTGRNLLDARWRESEFEYASNFLPGTVASPTPVRHFTAGAPFSMFATLTLSL